MVKKTRAVIMVFCSLMVCMLFSCIAYAEETQLMNVMPDDSVLQYVEENIAGYLVMMLDSQEEFGICVNNCDELEIGTPLAIISIADDYAVESIEGYYIPVFENGEIVITFLFTDGEDGYGLGSVVLAKGAMQGIMEQQDRGETYLVSFQGQKLILTQTQSVLFYGEDCDGINEEIAVIPSETCAEVISNIRQSYPVQIYESDWAIDNEKIIYETEYEETYTAIKTNEDQSVSSSAGIFLDGGLASAEMDNSGLQEIAAPSASTLASSGKVNFSLNYCVSQYDGGYRPFCWLASSATTLNLLYSKRWIDTLAEMADRAGYDYEELYDVSVVPSVIVSAINSCTQYKYKSASKKLPAASICKYIDDGYPIVLYCTKLVNKVHCVVVYGYSNSGDTLLYYDPYTENKGTMSRSSGTIDEGNYGTYTWSKSVFKKYK